MATTSRKKPVRERQQPAKKKAHKGKLTSGQKAEAKRAAKKAGRPYPNLVDNLRVARKTRKKKSSAGSGTKTGARKTAAKKSSARRTGANKSSARRTGAKKRSTGSKSARKAARKATRKAARKTARGTRSRARTGSSGSSSAARTRDPEGGLTAAGRAEFARRDGAHLKPGVRKPMREMTPEEMRRKGSWATRFYGRKRLPPLVDADGKPTRFALSAHAWGEPVPKTEAAARAIAARGRKLLDAYERRKR